MKTEIRHRSPEPAPREDRPWSNPGWTPDAQDFERRRAEGAFTHAGAVPVPRAPERHDPGLLGLRDWRVHRELSQSELARRTGIDRTTINRLEQTDRSPQDVTAHRLARALRTTADRLFPQEEK